MLKKKQNLAELEHRLRDRIDDVIRILKATSADKNEVTRKNRLFEHRLESTLEIIVMMLCEEPEEMKAAVSNIVKGSKKLKNSNLLVSHLKSVVDLNKKLKVDSDHGGDSIVDQLDMRSNQPTLNLSVNRKPKRNNSSNQSGLIPRSMKLETDQKAVIQEGKLMARPQTSSNASFYKRNKRKTSANADQI